MFQQTQFILYVANQEKSKQFYQNVLQLNPVLDIPGMTEFELSPGTKLGLMPESGIKKILQNNISNPASGNGIPRCEIYLLVDNIQKYTNKLLQNGAKLISPAKNRDWGHKVAYFADFDGHIIAFAEKT